MLLLSSLALYTHRHTGKNFRFHGIFLFFSEKMLSIYQLSCERRNLVFCFDNFCEILFCFLQRILISFSCGIMNNQNIGRTYYSSCKKNNSFFSWNCNYVLISRKIIFQTFQTGVCAPFDFFSSFSSDSGFLVSVVVVSSTMAFFSGVGFTSSANLPFSGSSNASFSSSRGSPDLAIIFWEGERKKRKKQLLINHFWITIQKKKFMLDEIV